MKRVNLSDTVRLPDGREGRVTGTMTLGPTYAGGTIKRSVCVMCGDVRGPIWLPMEDVALVEKAKR